MIAKKPAGAAASHKAFDWFPDVFSLHVFPSQASSFIGHSLRWSETKTAPQGEATRRLSDNETNCGKDRGTVREARVQLTTPLDQLGKHILMQEDYDDAVDALTEALQEKKSI